MKQFFATCILFISISLNLQAQLPVSAKNVKPLLIGSKIPNTTITTFNKGEVSTDKLFSEKQTILVVYRGGWCPFCSRQLSGLAKIKRDLFDLDYQIVAVSPDSKSNKESLKYAKNYIVGSDSKTELIRKLGIAYKAPKKYSKILRKNSGGVNTNVIPAPSVFILNSDGEILFEHVSTNFRKRISSELLLSIAAAYKE